MRFVLTAEELGATEVLRIGLVQEVVPAGQQLDRTVAIACAVAVQAPLGFREPSERPGVAPRGQAGRCCAPAGTAAGGACEPGDAEGLRSFVERHAGRVTGR